MRIEVRLGFTIRYVALRSHALGGCFAFGSHSPSRTFAELKVLTAGRHSYKKTTLRWLFYMDARLGFEPRLTASKAAVLPLDDRAN
jgi:hypothetical protein